MADSKFWLDHGQQFPYAEGFQPLDAADKAALAILANLCDRRGIKHELRAIDNDVRVELLRDVAEIIRAAGVAPAAPTDTQRLHMILDTFGKREDNMPLTDAERKLILAFDDRGSYTKDMKLRTVDDAVRAAGSAVDGVEGSKP